MFQHLAVALPELFYLHVIILICIVDFYMGTHNINTRDMISIIDLIPVGRFFIPTDAMCIPVGTICIPVGTIGKQIPTGDT